MLRQQEHDDLSKPEVIRLQPRPPYEATWQQISEFQSVSFGVMERCKHRMNKNCDEP